MTAYCFPFPWSNAVYYVANLPANGADWGYTDDESQAIKLNAHWQRRFTADQHRCGRQAYFLQASK